MKVNNKDKIKILRKYEYDRKFRFSEVMHIVQSVKTSLKVIKNHKMKLRIHLSKGNIRATTIRQYNII